MCHITIRGSRPSPSAPAASEQQKYTYITLKREETATNTAYWREQPVPTDMDTTPPHSPTASPTSPVSPIASIAGTIQTTATNVTTMSNTTVTPTIGGNGQNPASILLGGGNQGPIMTEEEVNSLLRRLSSKQSVESLLILSRTDGAVIRSTFPSSPSSSSPSSSRHSLNFSTPPRANNRDSLYSLSSASGLPGGTNANTNDPSMVAEAIHNLGKGEDEVANETLQYATMVWKYVKSTEELVAGLDALTIGINGAGTGSGNSRVSGSSSVRGVGVNGQSYEDKGENPVTRTGDELKLLRIRTKRHELVIVPDGRFILVVVHGVGSVGVTGERGLVASRGN